MAGLFDYSNYQMSPEELDALEKEVRRTGADMNARRMPSTVNMGMGGLEAEYIPKEAPKVSKPAGLLGYDNSVVSTQQQSGINPDAKPRTFYGGKDGGMSTNMDDVSRKPTAASRWTPDGTHPENPKPRGVDYRAPAETRPNLVEAAKGSSRGLLGRIGAALGGAPATGLQALVYSADVGEGSELSPDQREANNPGEQADAAAYAQRVQDNARQAAQPPLQGAGLLMAGQPPVAQASAAPASPQVPPAATAQSEQTPKPLTPTEQKARAVVQAHAQEKQRQTIESNVLDGLKTNKLSRVKAAEAVVQADTQRQGLDLTPVQKKAAVAQEVSSMRNMDNNNLAKYLSFAVMGLGFLAGTTSKANGQAFSNNFNTGYQTAIAREQAAKKLAYQQQKDANELDYKNRTLANSERDVTSKIGDRKANQDLGRDKLDWTKTYQGGVLDQGDRKLDQGDRRLGQGDVANSIAQQRANTAADANGIAKDRLELTKSRVAAQNAKDAASTEKLKRIDVPDISQKDAVSAIQGYYKDNGQKISDGAAATVADQVIRWRKKYPNVPTRTLVDKAAKQVGVKVEDSWFGKDDVNVDFGEE